MPEFNFNVEWKDGRLYITEEDGSGGVWRCKTPTEAGKYVSEYIESIIEEIEELAAESLLETIELYIENREY